MYIFTCKDRFQDKMCCIYSAWEYALKVGHDNISLCVEPVLQQQLFEEYIHIDYNEEHFSKVVRSIRQQLSYKAYMYVYNVSCSHREDALDTIYRFLVKGFKYGEDILNHYTDSDVMKMFEYNRSVQHEVCTFREFVRFSSLDNSLYVSHIEPKDDIIELIGHHFSDRMPSENWMIIDDNRQYAVVHPKNQDNYLEYFTDEEMDKLKRAESDGDEFTRMWVSYFNTIAIKERNNPRCQMNFAPLWKRKHMPEFKH